MKLEETRKGREKRRDEARKEERKRDEERRGESKIQLEILRKQNAEIIKTVEESFKDLEISKKAVEALVDQTEKQGEERKKIVRTNQEKCDNRSKMLRKKMNRVQEDTQHSIQEWESQMENINRKLKENEQRLTENDLFLCLARGCSISISKLINRCNLHSIINLLFFLC